MDLRALILAGVLGIGIVAFLANRSIYFPAKYPEGDWGAVEAAGLEDVWLDSSGVRIHGLRFRRGTGVPLLLLHGNAGNATHRISKLKLIADAGYAPLLVDYRGYGKSEGWPTQRGLQNDALAGYKHLLATGHPAERIVVYGESLGSTLAVLLASEVRVGGVILEGSFPSAQDVAATVLPLLGPILVRGFNAGFVIHQIQAPFLFVHGDRDEVIPIALGRRLFERANRPKEFWTVQGAGHNDLPEVAGAAYVEALRNFAASLPSNEPASR